MNNVDSFFHVHVSILANLTCAEIFQYRIVSTTYYSACQAAHRARDELEEGPRKRAFVRSVFDRQLFEEKSVSLRQIHYYVVKFAPLRRPDVHRAYKQQLKKLGKRSFDVFCRRSVGIYNTERYYLTTLPQRNFFEWFTNEGYYRNFLLSYNDVLADMRVDRISLSSIR